MKFTCKTVCILQVNEFIPAIPRFTVLNYGPFLLAGFMVGDAGFKPETAVSGVVIAHQLATTSPE